jgi:protein-serine/threonine kinase
MNLKNRLITSADRRLNVEQMRKHHFFYGVDWETIGHIDAPFVPHLRSITDTSYFPTDELDQVPEEPVGADTSGANKDLAFLGYVANKLSARFSFDVARQIYFQAVYDVISSILIRIVVLL